MLTPNSAYYHPHKEYSGWVRLFHWIRALAIFALMLTGFYIAYPFLEPHSSVYHGMYFLQAYIRSAHIMLGFILIAISLFRFYLFFFDKKSRAERMSVKGVFSQRTWIEQLKVYFLIGHRPEIKGVYNPLQFVAYFSLCMMLVIIALSGIVLYYNVYHRGLGGALEPCFRWFEVLCGGLSNVRYIHHLATWGICLFIPVHIYMVVFHSLKFPDGGADVMISGRRYLKG
ncbi:Ni/Fe-hydrogenase, b-type cytochrome subunit [Helicobacter baculiformis]|uniref:Ni/Fe-hydrogenase, b-type cytochrome subunit n=1 Tax=Helicobacter baculiformis TaxID=427351 RepID=A0ABV7ZJH2_9HELI|nr:Ni/Fe-hydrogenase, b-type cytochrome subunit [Helicobacter baculiformis]